MNINTTQYLNELQNRNTNVRSERDEIVSKFVDAINNERTGTAYKPVNAVWFNTFLKRKTGRKMKNSELHSLYQYCDRYNGSFSKIFFGSFKQQSWN